jgi:Crp-like helix-turn-helix domain
MPCCTAVTAKSYEDVDATTTLSCHSLHTCVSGAAETSRRQRNAGTIAVQYCTLVQKFQQEHGGGHQGYASCATYAVRGFCGWRGCSCCGPTLAKAEKELVLPRISQETLAEIIGTTRSRVSSFLHKFRKLGFIDYNGGLRVHSSLLNVVLYD